MDTFTTSVLISAALVAALLLARVVEVLAGHTPTQALTLAFQAAVTALLAMLAVSHAGRSGR